MEIKKFMLSILLFSLILIPFISASFGYNKIQSNEIKSIVTNINITTTNVNDSNTTEYWRTNEGMKDNVVDILGSEITNDLGWVTSAGIDSWAGNYTNYYNKSQVNSNFCYANGTNSSGVNCQSISSSDSWKGNYTNYYNKTQIDSNFSLYTLITNLVSYVGNWSLNKINYWNSTQILNGTLALNSSLSNYYSNSNPLNFVNSTTISNSTIARTGTATCSGTNVIQNYTINQSGAFAQCITPTAVETEPSWNGNYTIFTGLINNASYLSTYNSTYAGYNSTGLIINHTLSTYTNWNTAWLSTFNTTYSNILNQNCPAENVVNGTYANGTFICVTPSSSSFNQTYHNYVTANYTNRSNYWDDINIYNSTQMENSGGYLNILVSWLMGLFYTESEIDIKIINNASYFSTYNETYAGYSTNVSINHTLNTYTNWNAIWSRTDNSSYRLESNYTFTSNVNLTRNNITNVGFFGMDSIGNVPCIMPNGTWCRNASGLYYQSGT